MVAGFCGASRGANNAANRNVIRRITPNTAKGWRLRKEVFATNSFKKSAFLLCFGNQLLYTKVISNSGFRSLIPVGLFESETPTQRMG